MSGFEVPGLMVPEARNPSPNSLGFDDSVYQRLLRERIIFLGTQVQCWNGNLRHHAVRAM